MDCFFGKTYAVSGEKLYFCGICEPGRADYFTKVYCDVLSKADFNGLKDDYYIDIKLYKIINKADSNGVFALGAGVVINDALHIGGGIIGNPNEDGESANDAVESIGNGLYCIAYGGRFGAVFECEKPQAVLISEKIAEYNKLDIKTAVLKTRDCLIKNTRLFIMLSDGSGKGAYPYCAVFCRNQLCETDYDLNE